MEILIKKLNENAIMPCRATDGSAGMDLYACIDSEITVAPRQLVTIPTGIAAALPDSNYAIFLFARSGLATKHGITLSNSVGVVDSDYRGEIKVGLCNLSDNGYTIKPNERIAQMVVMPVSVCDIKETDTLPETVRGEAGFGSTGKSKIFPSFEKA